MYMMRRILINSPVFVSFGETVGLKKDFTFLFNSYLKYELEDTIYYNLQLSKPTTIEKLSYKLLLDTIKIPDSVFYKVGHKNKPCRVQATITDGDLTIARTWIWNSI